MIFSIDGNIGSGKSTIVRQLKKALETNPTFIFLEEPVSEWETIKTSDGTTILEKFYNDQDKYAFSFQMMAYISRLAQLRKTIRENPDCHIVTERSIYTDRNVFAKMLYDDKKIEEINYQIYLKWFEEFAKETKIDHIIYIDTTAKKCHERIQKRDRTGESCIPLEYLRKCEMYHDIWILGDDENITTPYNENSTIIKSPDNKVKNFIIKNNKDITTEQEKQDQNKCIIDFIYNMVEEIIM